MITRTTRKFKGKQSSFLIANSVVISVVVEVRLNRQQKRGTCFASLLQSELKSDVAHVTTQESNLSCNI